FQVDQKPLSQNMLSQIMLSPNTLRRKQEHRTPWSTASRQRTMPRPPNPYPLWMPKEPSLSLSPMRRKKRCKSALT
ncbi:MAG: hypothetical protein AAFV62_09030, partial [Pseudomonadota bacterium]